MDFSNITSHPDLDEIISKIVTGVDAKSISDWLKLKYPDKEQRHLQLSAAAIANYSEKHCNLMEHLTKNIQQFNSQVEDKKISASLLNNKSYKERMTALVNTEIDIKKTIAELVLLIRERAEQVFDKIQENPGSVKHDYQLIKWFETLLNAVEKYDKIYNNAPDKIIQHNITVQAVEEHTALFQDAIRETLNQMDPTASLLFMEIFSEKLKKLKQTKQGPTIDGRIADAELAKEIAVAYLPK